jgi:hypothetical protein
MSVKATIVNPLVRVPAALLLHIHLPCVEHLFEVAELPVSVSGSAKASRGTIKALATIVREYRCDDLLMEVEDHLKLFVGGDRVWRKLVDTLASWAFSNAATLAEREGYATHANMS